MDMCESVTNAKSYKEITWINLTEQYVMNYSCIQNYLKLITITEKK